jgi:branched-chain amino acid transport system ATP-binding protein
VVRDVELRVDAGEVVALLGPNGAGKTTTLLTLAGELAPQAGEVRFLGAPTRAPMHVRCRNGLGFVTEERSVIMGMTVAENLKLARAEPAVAFDHFPALELLKGRKAGLCSGGEQQMLSLARALGRGPKVLLADELSLGLAPIVVDHLLRVVRSVADEQGVGVLLVEQHVSQALRTADRVYVMERGRIALEGTSDEIAGQVERIEAAYLTDDV